MSDTLKYSFSDDSEPTDEQLELLMKEVSAEAKRKAYLTEKSFYADMVIIVQDMIQKYNVKYSDNKTI